MSRHGALSKIKQVLLGQSSRSTRESNLFDAEQIDAFNANPDNPYLVSFPRTGSHWLRMILELYLEKPTLVRSFYFRDRSDFSLLHTHDMELDVERKRVIYLYRDPTETVYSQIQYHQEEMSAPTVDKWASLYGKHLAKWLHDESFTEAKCIVRYEEMREALVDPVSRICAFLDAPFDASRLHDVAAKVTKEEVKRKTTHDRQVVKTDTAYAVSRSEFRDQYQARIWEVLLQGHPELRSDFQHLAADRQPQAAADSI